MEAGREYVKTVLGDAEYAEKRRLILLLFNIICVTLRILRNLRPLILF